MANGGAHVAALWTEVNRCGQNGDFARALKAVNKSRSPGLTLTLTLVRHSDGIVSSGSSRC